MNTYDVVNHFEKRVADFTGATHAVAVDSCTNAIFLTLKWLKARHVTIPARTYCSVPMAIQQAGATVTFRDYDWQGAYQLYPYPVFDAAKRFRRWMYVPTMFICLSFHIRKPLPISRGGMILTDNARAAEWFRRARHNGRVDGDHSRIAVHEGWDMWMTPEQAVRGLALMDVMPVDGFPDQVENPPYPDLRTMPAFTQGPA